MKEKRLKLDNGLELFGELGVVFYEKNSSFTGEKKLTDLILGRPATDFSLDVYGRLWVPGIGGGPDGFYCRLCSLIFPSPTKCVLQTHGPVEFTENIFIPEFFYLLFRELEKTLAENWGDLEPEKKQALADWIKKVKRGMANDETYNKIRGRLDNDREKNLRNPEIVAALNHLARALGILPKNICLYGRPRDEEYQKAKKFLNLAGIKYEESYGINLELWVEGEGYRDLDQILEYTRTCPSIRVIA